MENGMSIQHVGMVLDARDERLSGTRKLVLIALANRTDTSGKCFPAQDLIASECGIEVRTVSDHLKALEADGFISRKTQHLGRGNGSRTLYTLHLDLLRNASEKIAGANNAHAINDVCTSDLPRVTNHQEPSITEAKASVVRTLEQKPNLQKGKGKVRGAARGARLSESWTPTPKDYAFASSHNLTREEINREADRFRNYWCSATGPNAIKLDWHRTWQNWLIGDYGIVTKRAARQTSGAKPSGQSRGGGMVAAGLRAISEARGYGQPLPPERDMGTGYDLDGDTLRIAGGGQG